MLLHTLSNDKVIFAWQNVKFLIFSDNYLYNNPPSTDMLELVSSNRTNFNNREIISRSRTLTRFKMTYYQLFARLYGWCGRSAACVMVNSTWTQNHINQLWQLAYKTRIVYPPCDVKLFEPVFGDKRHDQRFHIVSVAQFRPEKNHALQIHALAKFIQKYRQQLL